MVLGTALCFVLSKFCTTQQHYAATVAQAPPSTIGTLRFPSFGGRHKMKKRTGSQHSQQQSECAATKQRTTLVSAMEPDRKRARSDASHGVFSEQTCSRGHFRSKKWGSHAQHFKRPFVRLTRPACTDINALPFVITRTSHVQRAAEPERKQPQHSFHLENILHSPSKEFF